MSELPTVSLVLAGGTGARFWPLSRELGTKQLLSMFGSDSLIAGAIVRGRESAGADGRVLVVTGERLLDELRNSVCASEAASMAMPEYVCEPASRGTAPAVALAIAKASSPEVDPVVLVLPSDQVSSDSEAWTSVALRLCEAAASGYVGVLALESRKPSSYGYFELESEVSNPPYRVVAHSKFRKSYEGHLVHTGVWAARASVIRSRLLVSESGRAVLSACSAVLAASAEAGSAARDAYTALTTHSIEEFLFVPGMTDCVAVVGEPHLHQVSSFDALSAVLPVDSTGNARLGRGVDVDSRNCIVYAPERLVATLGLQDMVVVDTADATLVCSKDRVNDVRQVVEALRSVGAEEIIYPRTSRRPWGSWTSLHRSSGYQMKLIQVDPAARLSLQSHAHRSEHWIVVQGCATVTKDGEMLVVPAGESVFIPAGCIHRLENAGEAELQVVEVQVGEYLHEDDIVRHQDDFDRG